MIRLDNENADCDLTTEKTVLTYTLPASPGLHATAGYIKVGDGTKNLAGSGTMTLRITAAGVETYREEITITTTRRNYIIPIQGLPGGAEIKFLLLSSNGSDTDVDVTADCYSHDIQYHEILENAHQWFVEKTGNDSNGGHTRGDALLTVNAAVTAAASGDKIIIGPGTYDERVDLVTAAKTGLTIEGTSRALSIIKPAAGGIAMQVNDAITLRDISVISQAVSSNQCAGIYGNEIKDLTIENCYVEGHTSTYGSSGVDGIYLLDCLRTTIKHTYIFGSWDAIYIGGGGWLEDVHASTDCSCAVPTGTQGFRGIAVDETSGSGNHGAVLFARNCSFHAQGAYAGGNVSHMAGAAANGTHVFDHCFFSVYHRSATGVVPLVAAFVNTSLESQFGTAPLLVHCTFASKSLSPNVPSVLDISCIAATVAGGSYSLAKTSGTITREVAVDLAAYDPPTNAELEARSLAAASYATAGEAAAALTAYDPPTNAELVARSLAAAAYATATGLATSEDNIVSRVGAAYATRYATAAVVRCYTAAGATVQDLSIAQHEAGNFGFNCTDDEGYALDLTAHSLRLTVTGPTVPIVKGNGVGETGLTVLSPASHGHVVVSFTATETAVAGGYTYELWDVTSSTLLATGDFVVRSAHGPGD